MTSPDWIHCHDFCTPETGDKRMPTIDRPPYPRFPQRLKHLALDACPDGTLVKKIPEANKLYSLVISKIPSLESLPK